MSKNKSYLPPNRNREGRNSIRDFRRQDERPELDTQNQVNWVKCPECSGTGQTVIYSGQKRYPGDCLKCNGIGELPQAK